MTAMTPCPDRPGLLPRLSSTHVPRRSLSEPLLTSDARIKLLCAPAGSGKSALFAECFLQAPAGCRLHWLPLGGAALDARQMCEQLAQTLGLPVMDEAALLAHLARLQMPTWLFLDDYCRVPNPELDQLLDRLLNASSPALHLWLNGRRRPHCNWLRLLLDDELHEFDAKALVFTPDDIQPLLGHLPGPVAIRTAREVIQRSGGWCAGARITLLERCEWARRHASPGRPGTLLDYLEHELFSALTPDLAQAWRVLAHLPRFTRGCANICSATPWVRNAFPCCGSWDALSNRGNSLRTGCRYSRPWPGWYARNPGPKGAPGIDGPASGSRPSRIGPWRSSKRCWLESSRPPSVSCST